MFHSAEGPMNVDELSSLVRHAFRHRRRKGSGEPYWNHLQRVRDLVRRAGGAEALQAAALLHDVQEDLGWTPQRVEALAGPDVARWVAQLSEDKRLSWKDRKQAVIDWAAQADPEPLAILLADKLDNLASTLAEMPADPAAFREYWSRFNAPPALQAWFYRQLHESARRNRVASRSALRMASLLGRLAALQKRFRQRIEEVGRGDVLAP